MQVFNRISWHEVPCGNSSTSVGFGPEGCTVTAVCLCCTLLGTQLLVNRHTYHLIYQRPCRCLDPTNKHATVREDVEPLNTFSDSVKTIIHGQNIFKTVSVTQHHYSRTSARSMARQSFGKHLYLRREKGVSCH